MVINWTVLTYFVIGLFALNGFFRGWWKEAIATAFLVVLLFFLQQPGVAQFFINLLNNLLATIWQFLPASLISTLRNFFENSLGVSTAANGAIQANSSDPGTWLMVLVILLGVATLIGRFTLPDYGPGSGYAVTPVGGILGGLLGGLNGFIIINLVREYLDGRNLPGGGLPTEIARAGGGGAVGMASSGLSLQASAVPSFTILDSFLPWLIIGIGIVVFLMALRNRIALARNAQGFRRVDYRPPFGYQRYG